MRAHVERWSELNWKMVASCCPKLAAVLLENGVWFLVLSGAILKFTSGCWIKSSIAYAQATPVFSIHQNRCADVFHRYKISTAHVSAISLQQDLLLRATGGQANAVIEEAPISGIGGIPNGIIWALRQGKFRVMSGQKSIKICRRTENHARVNIECTFQNLWQILVRDWNEGS